MNDAMFKVRPINPDNPTSPLAVELAQQWAGMSPGFVVGEISFDNVAPAKRKRLIEAALAGLNAAQLTKPKPAYHWIVEFDSGSHAAVTDAATWKWAQAWLHGKAQRFGRTAAIPLEEPSEDWAWSEGGLTLRARVHR